MKDFFCLFVMSHYHGRYKSEEISPPDKVGGGCLLAFFLILKLEVDNKPKQGTSVGDLKGQS